MKCKYTDEKTQNQLKCMHLETLLGWTARKSACLSRFTSTPLSELGIKAKLTPYHVQLVLQIISQVVVVALQLLHTACREGGVSYFHAANTLSASIPHTYYSLNMGTINYDLVR